MEGSNGWDPCTGNLCLLVNCRQRLSLDPGAINPAYPRLSGDKEGEAAAWSEEADANQAYKGALSGGGAGWAVQELSCAGDLLSFPKSPCDPF